MNQSCGSDDGIFNRRKSTEILVHSLHTLLEVGRMIKVFINLPNTPHKIVNRTCRHEHTYLR